MIFSNEKQKQENKSGDKYIMIKRRCKKKT